jgi:hypothetical protein
MLSLGCHPSLVGSEEMHNCATQVSYTDTMPESRMMIVIDLENMAHIAGERSNGILLRWRQACDLAGVEMRTYTARFHGLSDVATHLIDSSKRDAVDLKIALDIGAILLHSSPDAKILVVSKDKFASTDHTRVVGPRLRGMEQWQFQRSSQF